MSSPAFTEEINRMHPFRRSSLLGLAAFTFCIGARATGAQTQQSTMYVDIVVPFTLRELHPSVVGVFPSCKLGLPMGRVETQQVWFPATSSVSGEDRVAYLTKAEDGSYSGTLTQRLSVAVPPRTIGGPGAFMCQIGVKLVGGATAILEHDVKGPLQTGLAQRATAQPFALAPNTPDRVFGQFTW